MNVARALIYHQQQITTVLKRNTDTGVHKLFEFVIHNSVYIIKRIQITVHGDNDHCRYISGKTKKFQHRHS